MPKKKAASRPAARPAVTKKWTGRHAATKSSTRKTIKSKAGKTSEYAVNANGTPHKED